VTSEARVRPRDEEEDVTLADRAGASTGSTDADADGGAPAAGAPDAAVARVEAGDGAGDGEHGPGGRGRPAVPLVPTLAVLLVLLLAAAGYLWFTRPGESAVRAGHYAEALQAARSGVVDLTSFDYLTLDDDIEQIRRVDERRQQITDAQAIVNTEVVGAGVTRANGDEATVLLIIESTQESTAGEQTQIVRYRIEVTLEKAGDRWLLSGIKGTETPGSD
jgi:hypothetical protein